MERLAISAPLHADGMAFWASVLDSWVWNGSNWTEMSPQASPPPLANSSVAYDTSSDQTLLFGGMGSSGLSAETWLWEAETLEAPVSITWLATLDGNNLIESTTLAVTVNDTMGGTWDLDATIGSDPTSGSHTIGPVSLNGTAMQPGVATVVASGTSTSQTEELSFALTIPANAYAGGYSCAISWFISG